MTRSPMPSRRIPSSASATVLSASSNGKSLRACSTTRELKSGMPVRSGIHHFYPMNDAFAFQNLFRFAEIIAHVALRFDPRDVALDSVGKIDLWFVANRADARDVAGEVAHLAGTKFATRNRRDVDLERIRNGFCNFTDRRTTT